MSDEAGRPEASRSAGPDRGGLLIAAGLILLGLIIGVNATSVGGPAGYSPVGPRTVPFIVAGGLVLLGALTFLAAFRRHFPRREPVELPPVAWVVGGLLLQMLTMRLVGFSIATGLLFALTARGFGRGPLWLTVPTGIVFAFLVWVVFAKGLQLSLPAGPLERLI